MSLSFAGGNKWQLKNLEQEVGASVMPGLH